METTTREIKMAGPYFGMLVVMAELDAKDVPDQLKMSLEVAMTADAAPKTLDTAPRRGNYRGFVALDAETFVAFEAWCKARQASFTGTLEAAIHKLYLARRAAPTHDLPHPLEL
jgi:hypothetical protein